MTRSEMREQIFRLLFCIEFYPEGEWSEQLIYLADDEDDAKADTASQKDIDYIQTKAAAAAVLADEIDDRINAVAKGWKTKRMGKVELAIIRLAVYEIEYDDDIPTGVAINEAVELAKRYGTEDAPSFVNGILAKIV
ncbi:MAG: transcription antitermination factor NusB [Eubacterium sp.]|nr:transcription antitermination factor NusB [Eubacterium sp.]